MTSVPARSLSEFYDLLPIAPGTTWNQQRSDELAGLGSADTLSIEMASPLWGGEVVLDWSEWPEARRLAALVRALNGPTQTFLMPNPIAEYPAADPDGTIVGASPVTILAIDADNTRISFAGLPEGYELGWGDLGEVVFGANPERRFVFEVWGTATANGFGNTALVPIGPFVWPGVAAGMSVNFRRPAAKMFIVPGTLREGAIRSSIVDGMSFTVKQRP